MRKLIVLCLCLMTYRLFAQPKALDNGLSIERVLTTANNPVRIDKHPLTNEIYLMNERGEVYLVNPNGNKQTLVFTSNDHGLQSTFGFEIGATGNFYLVAAEQSGGNNIGKIAKGVINETGLYEWTILAQTEPYRQSGNRDHQFSAIVESLDGKYVYVNSGSRTDHAEEAKNDGLREMPITSAILKVPVNSENLLLMNDEKFLHTNGYIYADGIRNTFDMEFAPNGDLFGVENSDTRDNEEELNWLQEGKHYGFPWKIGTHDNPQQFPDFNPPGSDNLIVQGINMESTFYNDPDFPELPEGITFTGPVINTGPHADMIRDIKDGKIKDANETGKVIGTFTPHSSPVALTFDTENQLGGAYTGGGFAMSYNSSHQSKYAPFLDPGEDLLFLELSKGEDNYTAKITRIAHGFNGPVDAVLVANQMYVIEYNGSVLWKVTFPSNRTLNVTNTNGSISSLVHAYPNPFEDELVLTTPFQGLVLQSAKVYNNEGKLISTHKKTDTEFLISTQGLRPGIYFIYVETDRGIALKKVIK